jgi:hypothetical protein
VKLNFEEDRREKRLRDTLAKQQREAKATVAAAQAAEALPITSSPPPPQTLGHSTEQLRVSDNIPDSA